MWWKREIFEIAGEKIAKAGEIQDMGRKRQYLIDALLLIKDYVPRKKLGKWKKLAKRVQKAKKEELGELVDEVGSFLIEITFGGFEQ